jgi:RNA polymerase sigma-70 factor, ECF subfamily
MRDDTTTQSIEQLYHEYYQPILRYVQCLVNQRETAEDLVHETFIKALCHWEQLNQAMRVRGWLYRIATNTAYDYLRRRRRVEVTPLTDDHAMTCLAPLIESRLADAEPIQMALHHIPTHYRLPLLLASAGYDHQAIAEVMGLNVTTVKTRVHRARTRFRQVYIA